MLRRSRHLGAVVVGVLPSGTGRPALLLVWIAAALADDRLCMMVEGHPEECSYLMMVVVLLFLLLLVVRVVRCRLIYFVPC